MKTATWKAGSEMKYGLMMRIRDWLSRTRYRIMYCRRYGHFEKDAFDYCLNCGKENRHDQATDWPVVHGR